jgi:hypothetical protein
LRHLLSREAVENLPNNSALLCIAFIVMPKLNQAAPSQDGAPQTMSMLPQVAQTNTFHAQNNLSTPSIMESAGFLLTQETPPQLHFGFLVSA